MADETTLPGDQTQVEAPDAAAVQAELEKTRIALKAANKEAADRRKRLEELESAEEARKAAAMTDLDKANKRAEDAEAKAAQAETRARETLIRSAFVAEAARVGAAHPEDVYLLADKSAVDVDDTGGIRGVVEAVKTLVDAGRIPLSGRTPAPNLDGGAGGGDRGHDSMRLTADEMEIARKLNIKPEKYAANKAAMKAEQVT
jgi:hypothetical protein